jgi:DNA polymerase-3 subunit epsilon
MKVIVFDTETTGLPTERNPSIFDFEKWPYIVQLSYVVYDTNKKCILENFDNIIRLHDNIDIPEVTSKIHGITKEISNSVGVNIVSVLTKFNKDLQEADIVVGHNISFDKRLVMVECMRNKIEQSFNFRNNKKPEYCTMKNSIDICKIEKISANGEKYFKYPRLNELYYHLFEETPKGIHNSLIDVLICLRCYVKLAHNYDIINEEEIKNIFIDYSI